MRGRQKVIVSVDKDMKSIPGFFYDMGKPDLASSPSAGKTPTSGT